MIDGTLLSSQTNEAPELRPKRLRNLPDQIADAIVEAIGLGHLQPGHRIVEGDIAQRLGVSRVPVREAVRVLETQGILDGIPNRGARVADLSEARIEQVCEARIALESIAARHLQNRLIAGDRVIIRALNEGISGLARAVRSEDPIAVNRADIAFHRGLCALSGNRIVASLWEAIGRFIAIVFAREILTLPSLSEIVREHELLRDAILSGDPATAETMLQTHVLGLRRSQRAASERSATG
jgi:DNA-binding GntR family transcriptional regulator